MGVVSYWQGPSGVAVTRGGEILDLSRDTYQHPAVRAPVCEISRPIPREVVDVQMGNEPLTSDLPYTKIGSDRSSEVDYIDDYLSRLHV